MYVCIYVHGELFDNLHRGPWWSCGRKMRGFDIFSKREGGGREREREGYRFLLDPGGLMVEKVELLFDGFAFLGRILELTFDLLIKPPALPGFLCHALIIKSWEKDGLNLICSLYFLNQIFHCK